MVSSGSSLENSFLYKNTEFWYTFKMNISDIENLAELAKIGLTDEEKENLLKDLDSILGYIKQIREVKTDEIIPEDENGNVWREDNPSARQDLAENFSREKIVEQFPDAKDGFVKVKKILWPKSEKSKISAKIFIFLIFYMEIKELTIKKASELLYSGGLTSVKLVSACLKNIEEKNKELNIFLEVF